MIQGEILKITRQNEIRTNRIVTEFAARARLDVRIQLVFWPALTRVRSRRGGFYPVTLPVYPVICPAKSIEGFPKDAVSDSRSPWGEGLDEGRRETNFIPAVPEPGCVRSASRSTSQSSSAFTNRPAPRLGFPPSLRIGTSGRYHQSVHTIRTHSP
jgi:hypothetical protein